MGHYRPISKTVTRHTYATWPTNGAMTIGLLRQIVKECDAAEIPDEMRINYDFQPPCATYELQIRHTEDLLSEVVERPS